MSNLKQVAVLGLGLLGGSISLAVQRSVSNVKTVGFSHRDSTRKKSRQLAITHHVSDDLSDCVKNADIVILATPICTFRQIFKDIAPYLKKGTIVSDVGSTKTLVHRWAKNSLPKNVNYVGSHPIAGSEKRGVEFARDDLFDRAACIVTTTPSTNKTAAQTVKKFWQDIGCRVEQMTPAKHDRVFANVSHVPHVTAAALINATNANVINFAGKGFMDTSRVASGPPNIWADILLTNPENISKGIKNIQQELEKLKKAVDNSDKKQIIKLLERARLKRSLLIEHKLNRKELV
jgi:prephenate dehydrogenase